MAAGMTNRDPADSLARMELTHDDVKRILEIIDRAEHLDEVELVFGGFHLHVRRGHARAERSTGSVTPVALALPTEVPKPSVASAVRNEPSLNEPSLAEGEAVIRAPMLGTFYRASAPGQPPFVEAGQHVKADDTLCLIEVMKLFNSVRAGVDGVVRSILAENGSLVEYNQILFVITPPVSDARADAMSVPE
jgi:acetyl-CoA carboxylase biotin carboxyl carrier protein